MLTAAADLNFNVVPSGLSVLAELWRSRYHTVENILEGDVFVQDASMISPARSTAGGAIGQSRRECDPV